jgi:hypothetical protein
MYHAGQIPFKSRSWRWPLWFFSAWSPLRLCFQLVGFAGAGPYLVLALALVVECLVSHSDFGF